MFPGRTVGCLTLDWVQKFAHMLADSHIEKWAAKMQEYYQCSRRLMSVHSEAAGENKIADAAALEMRQQGRTMIGSHLLFPQRRSPILFEPAWRCF